MSYKQLQYTFVYGSLTLKINSLNKEEYSDYVYNWSGCD